MAADTSDLIESVWDALDAGDLPRAQRLAIRALDEAEEEDEVVAATVAKARVELELERPDDARATLATLPPVDVDLDDPGRALDVADVYLDLGDVAAARARYQRVCQSAPEISDAWYGLGVCHDIAGDEAARTKAWLRALETDDAAEPPPDHLTEAEFAEVAEEALAELPDEAQRMLRDVPIIVGERPSADDVAAGVDPRILGMFVGTPLHEGAAMGASPHITQIVLFRDNLERATFDPDELREEIVITLRHEVGHFLGLDEDDLDRLGLA